MEDGSKRVIKTRDGMRSTGGFASTGGATQFRTSGGNFRQTASTKSSMDGVGGLKKKYRRNWDNRILPISTYNERVFPKYKVLFEDL